MHVQIRAHGALTRQVSVTTVETAGPLCVADLLTALGLAGGGVWLILVNGIQVSRSAVLQDGDRVELVPPLGGG